MVQYLNIDKVSLIDDYSTTNVTYIGKSYIGALTSAASWQIFKLDETSGMVMTFANGNSEYTNIWDNRLSLSYS